MEAATVRERDGNARGLSVAATVSNPMGHHPYLHDSTRGSQTSLWVERSSTLEPANSLKVNPYFVGQIFNLRPVSNRPLKFPHLRREPNRARSTSPLNVLIPNAEFRRSLPQ